MVRGLIARNVGNTSVELYWDPPEFSNGVLLFYKVWANGKDHKVNEQPNTVEIDNTQVTRMNYTLKELIAFTEYDIAVTACTKECSGSLNTRIKTTIGKPGNFSGQPTITKHSNMLLSNYTSATIKWEEPTFKGGELDYYEFKTKFTLRDGSINEQIIKTRHHDCSIERLCAGDVTEYDFYVRAVNFVSTPHSKDSQRIEGSNQDYNQKCERDDPVLAESLIALGKADPHGWYLEGPWSPAIGHSCHTSGNSKQLAMLMILLVFSVAIVCMVFCIYRKIKDMKDILVQMPPGLEDLTGDKMKKGKDLGGLEKLSKPDILRNVDNTSINCEDENGQLLKRSLNGSLNGADCSSSMHSDSTRSEMDQMEPEDDIEYGELRNDQQKLSSDGLEVNFKNKMAFINLKNNNLFFQIFNINSLIGKEISPKLTVPTVMQTSTPMSDKFQKPNIILNPKMPKPSSGYVSQPLVKVISPASPMNNNGYVTPHTMFNVSYSFLPSLDILSQLIFLSIFLLANAVEWLHAFERLWKANHKSNVCHRR